MKRRRFKGSVGPQKKPLAFRKREPGLLLSIKVLQYDRIEFVRHALSRMAQRNITREQVIEAINNPTQTGLPTERGRQRIRREFPGSGKVIDVVYQEMADRIRVITVFPRPRL